MSVLQGEPAMASKSTTRRKPNVQKPFRAQEFLDSAGVARKVVEFKK